MNNRLVVVWSLAGLLLAATGSARSPWWVLENRAYYEPLAAEPRAAQISITVLGIADEFPFSVGPGRRRIWDISLGKEIPILGYEKGDGGSGDLLDGDWGLGLWLPVAFHMAEDFKDPSAPILNTDYRFGAIIKFQRGLGDSWLGARLHVGHESTHLGDEFTIHALREHSDFERINVSYEFWEYGLSYEWLTNDIHRFRLRHGGIGLINPNRGFYSDSLFDPDARELPRSARNFEPLFGFEWRQVAGDGWKWKLFLSLDTRLKTIYDYHKANSDVDEDRQWSHSIMLGLHNIEHTFQMKGRPEFFVRLYHGVNPHGQFRSQRDYTMMGVGIRVSL